VEVEILRRAVIDPAVIDALAIRRNLLFCEDCDLQVDRLQELAGLFIELPLAIPLEALAKLDMPLLGVLRFIRHLLSFLLDCSAEAIEARIEAEDRQAAEKPEACLCELPETHSCSVGAITDLVIARDRRVNRQADITMVP